MTLLLIVANAAVFLWQLTLPPELRETLLRVFGVVPARLAHPAWAADAGYPRGAALSLLTATFLHGGVFHLVSNMWALWLFGDNVEDRLGHFRYLLFYLVCGVASMLAHVLFNGSSVLPAVGASGAIAGVMGAYLLMYPFARMVVVVPLLFYPLFVEIPAVVFLLLWILSQLVRGTGSLLFGAAGAGGIAFWAHVGGFFAGMALARCWCFRPRRGAAEWGRQ
jgi:membrane associated rhomboid family serine protease